MSKKEDDKLPSTKDNGKAEATAPKGYDEILFKKHDVFNLFFLPLVIASNLYYLLSGDDKFAYEVEYAVFMIYLLADTAWLIFYPKCVPSPTSIIIHHFVCIYGWNLPMFEPLWRGWISVGVLVEINTFCLVSKRNMNHHPILEGLFYLTWVCLRLVMYPYVFVQFGMVYYQYSLNLQLVHDKDSSFFYSLLPSFPGSGFLHSGLIFWLMTAFITFQNITWSIDLVKKNLKRGGTDKNKDHSL